MNLKLVVAIIRLSKLREVESALTSRGVSGYSVTKVKGRGTYFNSWQASGLTKHYRIAVYTREEFADEIAKLITAAASSQSENDGFVAIMPVDTVYWINENREAIERDFSFHPGGVR